MAEFYQPFVFESFGKCLSFVNLKKILSGFSLFAENMPPQVAN